jgi:hypothetical protein
MINTVDCHLKALNHPSPLTLQEQEIVSQWMFERKDLLNKWAFQDTKVVNRKMHDKLDAVFNQLQDHMTPNDLAAILKERRNIRILKQDGREYDHFSEWLQAKHSLRNALTGPWGNNLNEAAILNSRLSDMSKLLDRYINLIELGGIKCLVTPKI